MKKLFFAGLVFALVACGSQSVKEEAAGSAAVTTHQEFVEITRPAIASGDYYLVFSNDEKLVFQGGVAQKASSQSGANQINAPPDALVAGIAVAIHAGRLKKRRKLALAAERAESDKVLQPYLHNINALTMSDLNDGQLYQLFSSLDAPFGVNKMIDTVDANVWKAEIFPRFVISSQEDTVSIFSSVRISESMASLKEKGHASTKDKPLEYQKRVVIQSYPSDNLRQQLSDRAAFKRFLQQLLAKSVYTVLDDFTGAFSEKNKVSTLRYISNGKKRVERGYKIRESCGYVLFESLQGDLKLLPQANVTVEPAACTASDLLTFIESL